MLVNVSSAIGGLDSPVYDSGQECAKRTFIDQFVVAFGDVKDGQRSITMAGILATDNNLNQDRPAPHSTIYYIASIIRTMTPINNSISKHFAGPSILALCAPFELGSVVGVHAVLVVVFAYWLAQDSHCCI